MTAIRTKGSALDPALVERLTRPVATSGTGTTIGAPFTGDALARVPLSAADEVRTAYARARAAQRAWANRPVTERAGVFLRLHDASLDRRAEILDLVQLETGKARAHAQENETASPEIAAARRAPARQATTATATREETGWITTSW